MITQRLIRIGVCSKSVNADELGRVLNEALACLSDRGQDVCAVTFKCKINYLDISVSHSVQSRFLLRN